MLTPDHVRHTPIWLCALAFGLIATGCASECEVDDDCESGFVCEKNECVARDVVVPPPARDGGIKDATGPDATEPDATEPDATGQDATGPDASADGGVDGAVRDGSDLDARSSDGGLTLPDGGTRDVGPIDVAPLALQAEWWASEMAGVAPPFSEARFTDGRTASGAIFETAFPIDAESSCNLTETYTSTGAAIGLDGQQLFVTGSPSATIGSPHFLVRLGPGHFASPELGVLGVFDPLAEIVFQTGTTTVAGRLAESYREIDAPPPMLLVRPMVGTPIDSSQPVEFWWTERSDIRTDVAVFELSDRDRRVVLLCTTTDEQQRFTVPATAIQLFLMSEPTSPAFFEARYEVAREGPDLVIQGTSELVPTRYRLSSGARYEVF
ncbi:MAG: hypothetical protein HY791_26340 [Deltaproteobacteria bacterium]|nr:hypothetical protein [Deltaproteobacteria bacterium]